MLVVVLVFLCVFQREVAALISRTRKVGRGGIETFETLPAQPTEDKKGLDEFFRIFDSPLLTELEQLIVKELQERKIEAASDRERALVRALASMNISLHFERIYGLIWASQVECLKYLNNRDQGTHISGLADFCRMGKDHNPAFYHNYPIDRWLGFLQISNLVASRDGRLFITLVGREFLKYLIGEAKPDAYPR